MLMVVGFVFLLLGLTTGLALILGPLGVWTTEASLAAYVLFALLIGIGYLLMAVAARTASLPLIARITGGLLILMAVVAAAGLVMISIAAVPAHGNPAQLWYVFAVGGIIGFSLLTAHRDAAR